MYRVVFLIWAVMLCAGNALRAQTVSGQVLDGATNLPMPDVSYENIYTHLGGVTDSTGAFSVAADKGQLIEFHKIGYKIARARIPEGTVPSYFKIAMEKGALELAEVEVRDKYRDYYHDSLRNHELYKSELEFPKMSTLDVINHPFSALSKRNRELWAFQKEYAFFEQEKYVDYTFNERLITSLTGLKGDSVQAYRRAYRPSYNQLRSMHEYDLFTYIRQTVAAWRRMPGGAGRYPAGDY